MSPHICAQTHRLSEKKARVVDLASMKSSEQEEKPELQRSTEGVGSLCRHRKQVLSSGASAVTVKTDRSHT